MTMWHLERELRKTGNPADEEFADIISQMRTLRGSDVPLPGSGKDIYLVPKKEHLHVLTRELVERTKSAFDECENESNLEAMRYPLVEKRKRWAKTLLPPPPDSWREFYLTLGESQKRFVSQSLHFANLHISHPTSMLVTDPALLVASLGDLREAASSGDLATLPQEQARYFLTNIFQVQDLQA